MQPRPFEEWIKKGHQQDTNLKGACARPTDKRSFLRGGGGYNQGSFVCFAKGCRGWVSAGVDGVVWVDVEGSSVLSGYWGKAQRHVPDRQFIAKTDITMRCSGVGGREVGVKICGIKGVMWVQGWVWDLVLKEWCVATTNWTIPCPYCWAWPGTRNPYRAFQFKNPW